MSVWTAMIIATQMPLAPIRWAVSPVSATSATPEVVPAVLLDLVLGIPVVLLIVNATQAIQWLQVPPSTRITLLTTTSAPRPPMASRIIPGMVVMQRSVVGHPVKDLRGPALVRLAVLIPSMAVMTTFKLTQTWVTPAP